MNTQDEFDESFGFTEVLTPWDFYYYFCIKSQNIFGVLNKCKFVRDGYIRVCRSSQAAYLPIPFPFRKATSINSNLERAKKMKAAFLLAALCAGPLGVIAQTTLQIAECDDLPSSITTDTTLQFTAQEVI